MKTSLSYLIKELKQARKEKSLSQRDLSLKLGLPQSHLSKIENALVDLQASTLIELARVLDREVMLIPRPLISTIQSILDQYSQTSLSESVKDSALEEPLYSLDEEEEEEGE